MSSIGSIFGGGGKSNNQQQSMYDYLRLANEQAAARNAQGQQLRALSQEQGDADAEIASMRKPGLGRALLSYRKPRDERALGAG
jgi:hypothetical protein